MAGNLEMLSGRGKKEYAKETQVVAEAGPDGLPASGSHGSADEPEEALVAM